jgi:hypothetical protein
VTSDQVDEQQEQLLKKDEKAQMTPASRNIEEWKTSSLDLWHITGSRS